MDTLNANCRAIVSARLDLDEEQKAKAKDLLSNIKGLMSARNRLVHSILAIDQSDVADEQPQQITALYSQRQKPGLSKTMSVEEAHAVAEKLRNAANELLSWTFSTLPAASRQQVHPV
ncbi:hypothetical protein ACTWQF_34270 [Streptomyces sp. 8N114]|uniref:hypothetical protein n=1 Tax=Streptomyces sp. 8N114 TaxID=3457419 RepID=UPI003FD5B0C3